MCPHMCNTNTYTNMPKIRYNKKNKSPCYAYVLQASFPQLSVCQGRADKLVTGWSLWLSRGVAVLYICGTDTIQWKSALRVGLGFSACYLLQACDGQCQAEKV